MATNKNLVNMCMIFCHLKDLILQKNSKKMMIEYNKEL